MQRDRAAADRFAERRRREDEAPRLAELFPSLRALRLEVQDDQGVVGRRTEHIRRIVVARAPALFFVPCGEPACRDGGHELTQVVLRALEDEKRQFTTDHICDGTVGATACTCTLHVLGIADYAGLSEGRAVQAPARGAQAPPHVEAR